MLIDEKLINYLEELSCLMLTPDEKERMAEDLENIIGLVAKLEMLDTTGVAERSHPFDNVNNFRDDEVCRSLDRQLVLKNAPQHNDEVFIAPMTVE